MSDFRNPYRLTVAAANFHRSTLVAEDQAIDGTLTVRDGDVVAIGHVTLVWDAEAKSYRSWMAGDLALCCLGGQCRMLPDHTAQHVLRAAIRDANAWRETLI